MELTRCCSDPSFDFDHHIMSEPDLHDLHNLQDSPNSSTSNVTLVTKKRQRGKDSTPSPDDMQNTKGDVADGAYDSLINNLMNKKNPQNDMHIDDNDKLANKYQKRCICSTTAFDYIQKMSQTLADTWSIRKVENRKATNQSEDVNKLRVLYAMVLSCFNPPQGGARNTSNEVYKHVKPATALDGPRISCMRSIACGLYAQTCKDFVEIERAWRQAYKKLYTYKNEDSSSSTTSAASSDHLSDLALANPVLHGIALSAMLCAWATVCNGADPLAHWVTSAAADVNVVRQVKDFQKNTSSKNFHTSALIGCMPCSPRDEALKTRLPSDDCDNLAALHLVRTTYYKIWLSVVECMLAVFDEANGLSGIILGKMMIRQAYMMFGAVQGLKAPTSRAWIMGVLSQDITKGECNIGCLHNNLSSISWILPRQKIPDQITPIFAEAKAAYELFLSAYPQMCSVQLPHECVPLFNGCLIYRYVALMAGWTKVKQSYNSHGFILSNNSLMTMIDHTAKYVTISSQSTQESNESDTSHSSMQSNSTHLQEVHAQPSSCEFEKVHTVAVNFLNGCRILSTLCSDHSQSQKQIRRRELQSSYKGPQHRIPSTACVKSIRLEDIRATETRRKTLKSARSDALWLDEVAKSWKKVFSDIESSNFDDKVFDMSVEDCPQDKEFIYIQKIQVEACLSWMMGDCLRRSENTHMPCYTLLNALPVL